MAQTQAMHQEQTPTTQIIYKWSREATTRDKLWLIFLLIWLIFTWVLFVMAIFGWKYLFGIYVGGGSSPTYIHVVLSSYITYLNLAEYLNSTTVQVFPRDLIVTTKPVTLKGTKRLTISEIERFGIVKNESKFGQKVLSTTYTVLARLHNGKYVRFFPSVMTKSEAENYLRKIELAVGNLSTDDKFTGGGL